MRVDRFTVLFLAFLLPALAVVVLGSTPVAMSAAVPAEPCLAEAGAESPTIDAESLAVVDATTRPGRMFSDAAASHCLGSPALSRAPYPPLAAHSDRSPPPA
jgi:hypothetical protein